MPHVKSAEETTYRINQTLEEFNISTKKRIAAFLAQLAHESGEFRYREEITDGSAYEGRQDLGNTQPGDGKRFKGRGDIQLTGRANYRSAGRYFGESFEKNPEIAATDKYRTRVAGWFWATHNLNRLADEDDFRGITKKINGGYNGYSERLTYYNRALKVLGIPAPVEERTVEIKEMPALTSILAQAAIPELIKLVPKLGEIFNDKDKPVPERNVEATTRVLEMVQEVTGGVNTQDSMEKLRADPELQMAFQTKVKQDWHDLSEMKPDQESVTAAHKRNMEVASRKGYIKYNPAFWFTIAILPLVYMVVYQALFSEALSEELRSAVVGAIMTLGFAGMMTYWLGTSHSGDKKDDRSRSTDRGDVK